MTGERGRLLYLKLLVSVCKTNEASVETLSKFADVIIGGIGYWESSLKTSTRLTPCFWELISVSLQLVREFLIESEQKTNEVENRVYLFIDESNMMD